MKDLSLNPTYMDTMSISGILVTFWFDKNIFILHKTAFFSFFYLTTIFAKDFDMNKLLKNLWRGRKQGRCGRSPMLKIEKYAHIYLVFAHARDFSKVCSYRSPWQTV